MLRWGSRGVLQSASSLAVPILGNVSCESATCRVHVRDHGCHMASQGRHPELARPLQPPSAALSALGVDICRGIPGPVTRKATSPDSDEVKVQDWVAPAVTVGRA